MIGEWDKKYLYTDLVKNGKEEEHDILIKVMNGANFMGVEKLLELSCACYATMFQNKTTEQLRELLHEKNDFTPDEEEQIRMENEWVLTGKKPEGYKPRP